MAVGRVVREDGDGLAVKLGSATIRLHPSVEQERPGLAGYVARDVAVGIRSEDMEDARLVRDAPAGTRLRATVGQVEAPGAQIVVHFEVDAPKVVTEDTKALEKDAHTEDVPVVHTGTRFVAAFAPAPGSGSATRSRSWSTPSACTSSTPTPAPPSGTSRPGLRRGAAGRPARRRRPATCRWSRRPGGWPGTRSRPRPRRL